MKDKRKDDDLDEMYWVRLNSGRIVSRMHYDRITCPCVKVEFSSPEEREKYDRTFRANVRDIYRKRGYPIPDKYKD